MTEIKLHNTFTNKLETLTPLHQGEVRMYTCGPTVYAYAHIGNFRTFMFQDILRRFLRSQGYRLMHVMNVTDVDDRIIANAAGAGVSIREYTEKYIEAFLQDMGTLNLEQPEILARATEHIEDMVLLIERLKKKVSRIRAMVRCITASQSFPSTASFPRSICRVCRPERAWMWTATKRMTLAISRCGSRRRQASISGRRASGRDARVGTSNVQPWR